VPLVQIAVTFLQDASVARQVRVPLGDITVTVVQMGVPLVQITVTVVQMRVPLA